LLFALFPLQSSLSEEVTPPEGFTFSKEYQRIPVTLNSLTYYAYEIEKTEKNTHTVGWLIVDSNNKTVSDKSTYEKLALAATVTKYIKENPTISTIMEADLKMLNEMKWKMALNEIAQSVIKAVSSYLGTITGNIPMGAFEEAVGMASFIPQTAAIELSDNYLDEFTNWVANTFFETLIKTGEITGDLNSGANFLKFSGVLESIIKKGALISAKKGIESYSNAFNILKNHRGPWSYEDAQKFLEGYTKGKAQAVAYGSWYLRLIPHDDNWFKTIGLTVWDNVVKQVLPVEIKDITNVTDVATKFVPLFTKIIKESPDKFFYNQVEEDIKNMTSLLNILRLFYNTSIKDSPASRTYNVIIANFPIWPMFHYNVQHTGRCPYDTSKNNGTLKWKYQTGSSYSPAIASDGTVYVGSDNGYLYAINPDSTLKWEFQTGNMIYSSPAIASDGTIYIGSEDCYLYALNPNGTLKWKYGTGGCIDSSPAIASDGTIYVGSKDHYLYAINPDGTLKWKFETGDQVFSSPAIASDGTIYVGSKNHCLYAVNQNGVLKWKFEIEKGDLNFPSSDIESSPAIASDGTIYVAAMGNYFYAVNQSGVLKWKYPTSSFSQWGSYSPPAIASDGTIYIGSEEDHYLCAINSSGMLKWKFGTGDEIFSSPVIASDGTIHVASYDIWNTYLYAIDPNGAIKWKYNAGHYNSISLFPPVISYDGTIYVGSVDHYLYAIGGK